MKQLLFIFTLGLVLFSCNTNNNRRDNLEITVNIRNLKKGTLYLEKMDLAKHIKIDSVMVTEEEPISFATHIGEPEVFYLKLKELPNEYILFFAEKGHISIQSDLKKFSIGAQVTGSKNQDVLKAHTQYTKKILFKNLDLIKAKFDALKANQPALAKKYENEYYTNLKHQYLFSLNYAIKFKHMPVAPYIALAEMEQAHPKIKAQLYDSLTPVIQKSKYGLILKTYLKNIKY